MADEWFYAQGDQQRGPVTGDELRQMVSAGRVGPDELVWREGMGTWRPAREVPELAAQEHEPTGASEPPREPVMIAPPPQQQRQQHSLQRQPLQSVPPGHAPGVLPYQTPADFVVGASWQTLEMLRQTQPWVRFIAVLLFIGVVLGFVGLVIAAVALSSQGAGAQSALLLINVVFLMIYVFPAIYLNRYASKIKDVLNTRSTADLTAALGAQKSFWKFIGIFTLVAISLYIVIICAGVGGALSGL